MLHSLKERREQNQHGNNNTTTTTTTAAANTSTATIFNTNSDNRTNVYNNNCQTIDIRSLAATAAGRYEATASSVAGGNRDPELGGLTATRLRTRARVANMHSSGAADSTAVIVNIGVSDGSENNITRSNSNPQTQHKLRRNTSGSRGATTTSSPNGQRQRKTSSSSAKDGGSNTGIDTQSNRQESLRSKTRYQRQQSNASKPVETSELPAKRRYQTPPTVRAAKIPERASETRDSRDREAKQQRRQGRPGNRRRHYERGSAVDTSSSTSTASSCNGSCSSDDGDSNTTTSSSSGEPNLPYPGFPEVALKYLTQGTRPRNWCLMMITNPYPF